MAGVVLHSVDNATVQPAAAHPNAEQLSEVLSDALIGGASSKPDIDSLLGAIGGAGHGHPDLANALALAGPVVHGPFGGPAAFHLMPLSEEMVLHAPVPVHA